MLSLLGLFIINVLDYRSKIGQLSNQRIKRIRSLFIVVIVAVMGIQGLLSFLLFSSLDQPEKLGLEYVRGQSSIISAKSRIRNQLIALMDPLQERANKKQSIQVNIVFNLFVVNHSVSLPDCPCMDLCKNVVHTYKVGYFYNYSQEILHPPQYS